MHKTQTKISCEWHPENRCVTTCENQWANGHIGNTSAKREPKKFTNIRPIVPNDKHWSSFYGMICRYNLLHGFLPELCSAKVVQLSLTLIKSREKVLLKKRFEVLESVTNALQKWNVATIDLRAFMMPSSVSFRKHTVAWPQILVLCTAHTLNKRIQRIVGKQQFIFQITMPGSKKINSEAPWSAVYRHRTRCSKKWCSAPFKGIDLHDST